MQLEEQHPLFPLTLTLPAKYKESCCRYLREYASAENSKTWAAMYLFGALEKAEVETFVVFDEEQGSVFMAALLLTQHEQDPDDPDNVPVGLNPYPLLPDILHAAVRAGWQEPQQNLRRVHLLAAQRLMRQHIYLLPRWESRLSRRLLQELDTMLRDFGCTYALTDLPLDCLAVLFAVYTAAEQKGALRAEEGVYLGELLRAKLTLDRAPVEVRALRDYHAHRASRIRLDAPEACAIDPDMSCSRRTGHEGGCTLRSEDLPAGNFFALGPLAKEDTVVVIRRLNGVQLSETHEVQRVMLVECLLNNLRNPFARPVLLKPTERDLLLSTIPVDRGAAREGISDALYTALHKLSYDNPVFAGVHPRVIRQTTKYRQAEREADAWNAAHPVGTPIEWKSSNTSFPLQCSTSTTGPASVYLGVASVPAGSRRFPLEEVTVPSPTELEEEDVQDEEVIQSYLEQFEQPAETKEGE